MNLALILLADHHPFLSMRRITTCIILARSHFPPLIRFFCSRTSAVGLPQSSCARNRDEKHSLATFRNGLFGISPLLPDGLPRLEDCRIELVDSNSWKVSSGLADVWKSNVERGSKARAFCIDEEGDEERMGKYAPPNREDPGFDEIEEMRIRGNLFYKLDQDSKEYEEYKFDFHGKNRRKGDKKVNSRKMVKACSALPSRNEKSMECVKRGQENKEYEPSLVVAMSPVSANKNKARKVEIACSASPLGNEKSMECVKRVQENKKNEPSLVVTRSPVSSDKNYARMENACSASPMENVKSIECAKRGLENMVVARYPGSSDKNYARKMANACSATPSCYEKSIECEKRGQENKKSEPNFIVARSSDKNNARKMEISCSASPLGNEKSIECGKRGQENKKCEPNMVVARSQVSSDKNYARKMEIACSASPLGNEKSIECGKRGQGNKKYELSLAVTRSQVSSDKNYARRMEYACSASPLENEKTIECAKMGLEHMVLGRYPGSSDKNYARKMENACSASPLGNEKSIECAKRGQVNKAYEPSLVVTRSLVSSDKNNARKMEIACSASPLGHEQSIECGKKWQENKEYELSSVVARSPGSSGKKNHSVCHLQEMEPPAVAKTKRTLTFNQATAPYHEPFCLDIFLSKGSVRASIIHRATSKVVAVAHSISKDMKCDLRSAKNRAACAAAGEVLAQRALADDIHNVVYTPRKGERLDGKLQIVVQAIIDSGIDVKVKLKQRKPKKGHIVPRKA